VSEDIFAFIFRVKMEAARSYHVTTWSHNPEDHDVDLHRRNNLKSGKNEKASSFPEESNGISYRKQSACFPLV
jgi:hypothetical protein